MNADAYYCLGDSHIVCQDYAIAGSHAPEAQGEKQRLYAVVCDGCSSSPNSDVGARLLANAARHIIETGRSGLNVQEIMQVAASAAGILGANPSCLDATLMTAVAMESGVIRVSVMGDGLVVGYRHNQDIETWDIDYSGAPGYGSYLLDDDRFQSYLAAGFGERKVQHAVNGHETHVSTDYFHDQDAWQRDFSPQDYASVFLFSDGVSSFYRSNVAERGESVPAFDVVRQVIGIKSIRGEFLVRRCRRFFKKECSKLGWSHYDDFAVAGIHLGGPNHEILDQR